MTAITCQRDNAKYGRLQRSADERLAGAISLGFVLEFPTPISLTSPVRQSPGVRVRGVLDVQRHTTPVFSHSNSISIYLKITFALPPPTECKFRRSDGSHDWCLANERLSSAVLAAKAPYRAAIGRAAIGRAAIARAANARAGISSLIS